MFLMIEFAVSSRQNEQEQEQEQEQAKESAAQFSEQALS